MSHTRLGFYLLHHLFVSFAHVLVYFTFVFELTCIFLHRADLMLGKGKLAELRALARTHKLASGSQTRWWRSSLPRADRPLKAQLLQKHCLLLNERNSPWGNQRGKLLKWSKRMKKRTMRRLRMASLPKGEVWHLLHHLLHLLSQHQHRLLPQLQRCQSKQYRWRLHFLRLRLTSPTSWRTLRVPPHLM